MITKRGFIYRGFIYRGSCFCENYSYNTRAGTMFNDLIKFVLTMYTLNSLSAQYPTRVILEKYVVEHLKDIKLFIPVSSDQGMIPFVILSEVKRIAPSATQRVLFKLK